jgi:hypothetical protein
MIACHIGGDPPHPGAEASRRIKLTSPAIRPTERLDEDVFRGTRVPNDPQNPAIHFSLELFEKRFERVQVALHEQPEEVAIQLVRHGRLLVLLLLSLKGSIDLEWGER